MNRFESILNNKSIEPQEGCAVFDPRPDLTADTILWQQLLAGAWNYATRPKAHPSENNKWLQLYGALLWMRAMGTSLVRIKTDNGAGGTATKVVIRPIIDPPGPENGNNAWPSQAEYDKAKVRILDPLREQVLEILGKMAG